MSRDKEQMVYGRKSCWAVFAHRPQDILRVFHGPERRRELAPLLKWAAAARIPYRELDEAGLRRVSGATHHEGVALAVRPLAFRGYDGAAPRPHSVWMALDRVDNPYNLGAILRTCAFFGVETVLVGGVAEGSAINGAALRAAEGGAETLRLVACAPLAPVLTELAWCGVRVVGLEPDAPVALGPEALDPPAVLVVGHEQEGLSPEVRGACSVIRAIPGRGAVSSLNVSVSAGIALAAFFSARGSGATRRPHDQAIGAEGPPPTAPPESPPRRPKRRGTKRRASGARRGG